MDNLIGKTILGYRIVDELGSGAYGTVYKAVKENQTGTYTRALKYITLPNERQYADVLNAMGGDIQKTNDYFDDLFHEIFSEVKILNEFTERDVPNVVRYYEHDLEVEDNPRKYNLFILMEYLTPFQNYLSDNTFTVEDSVRMALDILSGLSASHNSGVIHRDIKLDNIFVTNETKYKIGDFGVSKILDKETKALSVKGTPDFIAPEVYLGKEGYDNSVDLYSLGIVLYRLLNYNRNPFLPNFPETYTPRDEDEAFNKRMSGETPPLPMLGGEAIGNVILKAIAPRDQRFKTADEFYLALSQALNSTPKEETEVIINGEGTPFYNTYSSLKNNSNNKENTEPSLDQTVMIDYDPNDTAETISQNFQVHQRNSSPQVNTNPPNYNQNYNSGNLVASEPVATDNSNKKFLFWGLGILLIIAVLGIGFFMFGRNNESEPEETTVADIPSPTFSIPGGQYTVPQYIKINSTDPNVKIYYTIDGTEPTEASQPYNNGEEIKVSSNMTLRSLVVDEDGNKSSVTSADYIITPPQTNVASDQSSSSSSTPTTSTPTTSKPNNSYYFPDSNTRLLSESELYGMTEDELILARNEIFARKGRMFDTDWIANYFNSQYWYVPIYSPDDFDANSAYILNSIEQQNVNTIKNYEDRMGYD